MDSISGLVRAIGKMIERDEMTDVCLSVSELYAFSCFFFLGGNLRHCGGWDICIRGCGTESIR